MHINQIMLKSYRAAKGNTAPDNYFGFWDRDDFATFEKIIQDDDLWPRCQTNGIMAGLGGVSLASALDSTEITDAALAASDVADYEDLCSIAGADFVSEFLGQDIGAPMHVLYDNKKIVRHDLKHVFHAWRLSTYLSDRRDEPLLFVDIGGGYGGLAVKLKRIFPNCKIMIFDLPETNAIQTYFLNSACRDTPMYLYEDFLVSGIGGFIDGDFEFAILPPFTFERILDASVDGFINIESMMEMNASVVQYYFDGIQRALRVGGVFYCVNRYQKSFDNETRRIRDYPFDDRWYFPVSCAVWPTRHVHEFLAVRTELPTGCTVVDILRDTPPFTLADVWNDVAASLAKLRTMILGAGVGMGNPGLKRILFGLGENPRDPLMRLRRWTGRIKRAVNSRLVSSQKQS